MPKNTFQKILHNLSLISQVGLTMLSSIAIGFALGYLGDSIFNREVIFKLIGLLLGVGAGFYAVYQLIMGVVGDNNED